MTQLKTWLNNIINYLSKIDFSFILDIDWLDVIQNLNYIKNKGVNLLTKIIEEVNKKEPNIDEIKSLLFELKLNYTHLSNITNNIINLFEKSNSKFMK